MERTIDYNLKIDLGTEIIQTFLLLSIEVKRKKQQLSKRQV